MELFIIFCSKFNSITLTLAMFDRLLCAFGIFPHIVAIEHFPLTNQLFALSSNCVPNGEREKKNPKINKFDKI